MPTKPRSHNPSAHRSPVLGARKTAAQRGYGSRWQKARKTFLSRRPTCDHCEAEGRVVPATEVDHKIPHNGDQRLFWDVSNWQPLCKSHHSRKTAREGGLVNRGGGGSISGRPGA